MSHTDFDLIQTALNKGGTAAALDCLEQTLRSQKKYHELFEALKMKLRQQLGLPLWYQETTSDNGLDADVEERMEKGLLDACQQVGMALLDEGLVREAWMYLRPVGNKTQVAERLRQLDVAEDQIDELIEVTVYEGVALPVNGSPIVDRRKNRALSYWFELSDNRVHLPQDPFRNRGSQILFRVVVLE